MALPRSICKTISFPLLSLVAGALLAQTSAAKHTAHTSMSQTDQTRLHAALDAYDAGHPIEAEPILRDLSKRYPANFEASEALGSLYAESGDLVRALPFLQHAAEVAPKQAIAQANLGATLLKLGKTGEAVVALQKASALDPRNPASLSNLGQALLTDGKPAQAALALTSASALAPEDADLKYNLALALYNTGSTESAVKAAAVLATIPAASMTGEMHSLAADADEHAGHYALALAHFQAAAQKSPSDANLYALVAELLRHWNWVEAIEVAQFGAAQFPSSVHFRLAAGVAYYGKSDYKAAAEIFSSLLAKDPENATVAGLLGRSCGAMPDGISADCEGMYGFVERHPGNAILSTYAANIMLREPEGKRDLDKAAALLRTAIAVNPQLAEAYLSMGTLDQVRLQWQESTTVLERAVALRPAMAEAHYRLSRAYAHLGRREEAQEQIALHQKYSKEAKDSLDARMQEVMRFVLNPS